MSTEIKFPRDAYKKTGDIKSVIWQMQEADTRVRAYNRALINALYNGDQPFTDEEARENNIDTNVNFLEGTRMMMDARTQVQSAMTRGSRFFSLSIDYHDKDIGRQASTVIGASINRLMKRSLSYIEAKKSQAANIVLHGISPFVWPNRWAWKAEAFGVADVLIPDRTKCDMSNLVHFAVRREWTPAQLYRMTHKTRVDPGWNMERVRSVLAQKTADRTKTDTGWETNLRDRPEELQEIYKEGSVYFASSAVDTVKVWDFFFYDEQTHKWYRKILEEFTPSAEGVVDEFLYNGMRPYGNDWSEIAHWQFGNLSMVPPFRYYGVRSLGYLLYAVTHLQNRMRCRFSDAAFTELLTWFRVSSEADMDRVQRVNLQNLGIIPDGLQMVLKNERYTPDLNLITNQLQNNRQLMAESASSYLQNVNDTGSREMTAFEASLRMNSVNQMVSATLETQFEYDRFEKREICRRFLMQNSRDPDVKAFWEEMKGYGFPEDVFKLDRWTITPERPIGTGNKTLEIMQTERLMGIRNEVDPDQSRRILNWYVMANTDDARLANEIVNLEAKVQPSDTIIEAQQMAAAALMGLPVSAPNQVNRAEYIQTLLESMGMALRKVELRDGVAKDMEEVVGLNNLARHIQENLAILGRSPDQQQMVRALNESLSRFMNEVRAAAQRLEQKQQAEGGGGGGDDAEKWKEVQEELIELGEKVRIRESASRMKLAQSHAAWEAAERRKQAAWDLEQRRKEQEFGTDQGLKDIDKALEIKREHSKPNTSTEE